MLYKPMLAWLLVMESIVKIKKETVITVIT